MMFSPLPLISVAKSLAICNAVVPGPTVISVALGSVRGGGFCWSQLELETAADRAVVDRHDRPVDRRPTAEDLDDRADVHLEDVVVQLEEIAVADRDVARHVNGLGDFRPGVELERRLVGPVHHGEILAVLNVLLCRPRWRGRWISEQPAGGVGEFQPRGREHFAPFLDLRAGAGENRAGGRVGLVDLRRADGLTLAGTGRVRDKAVQDVLDDLDAGQQVRERRKAALADGQTILVVVNGDRIELDPVTRIDRGRHGTAGVGRILDVRGNAVVADPHRRPFPGLTDR